MMGQTYLVGAHFEALNEPVLVAASDLRCLFFLSNPFHLNDVIYVQVTYNFFEIYYKSDPVFK